MEHKEREVIKLASALKNDRLHDQFNKSLTEMYELGRRHYRTFWYYDLFMCVVAVFMGVVIGWGGAQI